MEQWRDIPGYEGIYEASESGKIRTREGKTTRNARFERRVWKQRVLKMKYSRRRGNKNADAHVSLWRDGVQHTCLVARMIALAWCPGYFDGATVNHKDGNSLNNRADNLEWISLGGNIRHGFNTGLYTTQIPCTLTDAFGNVRMFRSLNAASTFLGRSHGYVSGRINRNYETAYSTDGDRYKIKSGRKDYGNALRTEPGIHEPASADR